jgi:hypothetical protein
MKKVIYTFLVLLLCTFAASAQKLIITEVDAAENDYFSKASANVLGKKMDLNISGETLSVQIGNEPKLILTQYSKEYYETEIKTKNGIEKFSLQLKTTNSVIISAEFTATIIPNDEQHKKIWWTVTARNTDTIQLM